MVKKVKAKKKKRAFSAAHLAALRLAHAKRRRRPRKNPVPANEIIRRIPEYRVNLGDTVKSRIDSALTRLETAIDNAVIRIENSIDKL